MLKIRDSGQRGNTLEKSVWNAGDTFSSAVRMRISAQFGF